MELRIKDLIIYIIFLFVLVLIGYGIGQIDKKRAQREVEKVKVEMEELKGEVKANRKAIITLQSILLIERGRASWYGRYFHGRKTANGEVYDMFKESVAHKSLPFGTWVRVFNLENGRTLDLRVNDRGPFKPGRIVDLSYEAGKKLGMVEKGVVEVRIISVKKSPTYSTLHAH